jgi:hypothetical protein
MMTANAPCKYIDTAFSYTITTAGTIVNINLPGIQGTGNGQRTGDEIDVEKIEIREYMVAGDSVGNCMRAIYFQTKGYTPLTASNDLLANATGGAPGVTSQYQSFIEKTGVRLISDHAQVMVPSGSNNIVYRHHSHKLPIRRIAFDSGSSTTQNGQTQLLLISDSAITPNPLYTAVVRVYYRDV